MRARQVIGTVIALLLVTAVLAAPALAAVIRTGILCDSGETYCLEAWNGMSLIMYSDAGSTQKFKVQGSTGNVDGAGYLSISVPTAIASATPAALVNSAGGVSNLFELRQASTPVTQFNSTGGLTQQQWVNVGVPTTITTATPALLVNNAGVSNLLVLQKSATQVAAINGTGVLTSTGALTSASYLQGGASPAVASATTMAACTGDVCHITGTTNITDMTGYDTGPGRTVCLIFDGVLTFTDGNHLKLAGNMSTTADDTICLTSDGSNWVERSRSVN